MEFAGHDFVRESQVNGAGVTGGGDAKSPADRFRNFILLLQ
jgi:hypothetical protein